MQRDLGRLRGGRFDVLVIGGGINGAGAARDAAMRGLSVALVDKGDFASGTSSRSSKLVHGGIRYLEQRDFRLVQQASRERRILQRIAPHLVRPLPFLIPVYSGGRYGLPMIRLATWLYDALALFRNTHNHRILSARDALTLEPSMRAEGLRGAAMYYDAQMDDARLCLANVVSAHDYGAIVANYVEVVGLIKEGGQVRGAQVRDALGGDTFATAAARVVNTTGPWLDTLASMDGPQPPKARLTKGTHILVPPLTRKYAITIPASDDRVIFVIPWGDMSLVGTTDTDFDGDPDEVYPTSREIEYLLDEVRRIIPGHQLSSDSVISAYSGVRSLVWEEGVAEGALSREHCIYEAPSGLLSLAGGKYTTYRDVARQLIDRLSKAPCTTHLEVLPGAQAPTLESLEQRVTRAVEDEMAIHLEDVLRRRTQIAFGPGRGLPMAEPVSRVMARLCDWNEPRRLAEIARFAASMGVPVTSA